MHLKPGSERTGAVFRPRVRRQGDRRNCASALRIERTHVLDERVAIGVRQADIADEDLGLPPLQRIQGLGHGRHRHRIRSGPVQDGQQQFTRIGLVLDDEDVDALQAGEPPEPPLLRDAPSVLLRIQILEPILGKG
jgi:hypothetical protein